MCIFCFCFRGIEYYTMFSVGFTVLTILIIISLGENFVCITCRNDWFVRLLFSNKIRLSVFWFKKYFPFELLVMSPALQNRHVEITIHRLALSSKWWSSHFPLCATPHKTIDRIHPNLHLTFHRTWSCMPASLFCYDIVFNGFPETSKYLQCSVEELIVSNNFM